MVLGADALSTEQMQAITREFNLSETIFVMKPEDPANTAKVRIFFPGGEMAFAGHPTVGCAVLLAEMKYKAGCSFETEIRLEEKAGLVPVKVSRIGDHPRRPPIFRVDRRLHRPAHEPASPAPGALRLIKLARPFQFLGELIHRRA